MTDPAPTRRRSRLWLYAPFVLLVGLAAGWAGFWFVVQNRVAQAVDAALAREAGLGRSWTCKDRTIDGFPFRVELRCSGLTLAPARWGEDVRVETGPMVALGQIYTPGLVLLQITGPLRAALPQGNALELGWSRLEASLAHDNGQPKLVSVVVAQPNAVVTPRGEQPLTWKATSLEAHLRPDPERGVSEQAVDVALSVKGSVLPALDALLGTSDPGDVEIQAVATQTAPFRAGFTPDTLEAWRIAGGQVEVTRLVSLKGSARVEASARLLLDATHRVSGQINAGIAGIDQIAGIKVGGLMGGLGGLFGGGRSQPPSAQAAPGLTQLPPVVIRDGRFHLGPLRLPVPPLVPLY